MHWIVKLVSSIIIRWIVIYPVDSAIRPTFEQQGSERFEQAKQISVPLQITEQKDQYI